ncbi:MAG: hypothetical protein KA175_06950 [Flavobacteriales bacterium]|nr:hypothetical protein [Flavobacteriales bacterium]
MPERRLLLAAPRSSLVDLAPLLEAYARSHIRVEVYAYGSRMPDMERLGSERTDIDAMLLAGPRRFAPSSVLPGPCIRTAGGRSVPAAWLPITDSAALSRFAGCVARVHGRARQQTAMALLGQWHPRYEHLSDRIENSLPKKVRSFRWTSDVIGREEMISALGSGLGVAMYLGHGRPKGWVGYYGTRSHHFATFHGEPIGGLLSLCCNTASRRRTGLSFAEALPLMGVAACSFGAVSATLHTDNTRWAVRLCDGLARKAASIGELVVLSTPPNATASEHYRLIGDPLAPVAAGRSGARKAATVLTYP